MKLKKFDYLMILVVVVAALIPLTILYCGKIDRERHEQQQGMGIDSLRTMHRRLPRHDPREDSLKTLEDSIHFYEDGF